MSLTIGLIRASLPSYFPDRHGVFEAADEALQSIASQHECRLVVADGIPMDAAQTRTALAGLRAEGADLVVLLHGGFSMGDVAREVARDPGAVAFWATPEPNHVADIQLNNFVSLNMSMSIARGVRPVDAPAPVWLFGDGRDDEVREKLDRTLRALAMRKAVANSRIGVVGGLAPGFYNMEVDQAGMYARLGIEVEHLETDRLVALCSAQEPDDVSAEISAMRAAVPFHGVSEAHADLTARMALALRHLSKEGGFDALAVSDWPALQADPGIHPGAAFSWVEQVDNLPLASEGDVMGAVTQLAVRALTGKVGCLVDMTSPQPRSDRILMWHGGGGPLHLSDGAVQFVNHPMLGRGTAEGAAYGAIADYKFAHGPVTVCRIGASATNVFSFEASVVEGDEPGFTGCRGWVSRFSYDGEDRSAREIVASVLDHGVEHHFVLFHGHFQEELRAFADFAGLATLDVPGRRV